MTDPREFAMMHDRNEYLRAISKSLFILAKLKLIEMVGKQSEMSFNKEMEDELNSIYREMIP